MGKTGGDFGLLGTGGESVLALADPGLDSTEGRAAVVVIVLTLVTMLELKTLMSDALFQKDIRFYRKIPFSLLTWILAEC